MRKASRAGTEGDWEEFLRNAIFSAWTSVKVRECHTEAGQKEADRKSVASKILQKSADFLRRINVPVEGQEGVTMSYVCPHCHQHPIEDYIW